MSQFFDYRSHYRTGIFHDITIFERIIPLILIGIAIYILFKKKDIIRENKVLEKRIRYGMAIALAVLYISHYALRINLYGWTDTIVLPFHLCSIAMFVCVIMLFTMNKALHSFVLLAGTLGVVVSLSNPIIGYNFKYYRYYQFMFAHGILLIAPLYVSFVHNYLPSKKDVINGFIILQTLAIFMGVFNYFNNTDFFFMFVDPAKLEKFSVIKYVGGIPYYLIFVEVAALAYFYGSYRLFERIRNRKTV